MIHFKTSINFVTQKNIHYNMLKPIVATVSGVAFLLPVMYLAENLNFNIFQFTAMATLVVAPAIFITANFFIKRQNSVTRDKKRAYKKEQSAFKEIDNQIKQTMSGDHLNRRLNFQEDTNISEDERVTFLFSNDSPHSDNTWPKFWSLTDR